uniref:Uncharacterized protein n=1 Tax=Panagrolaimus davidi TaxID=227884 RepID=A0A914PH22_9BILA
MKQYNNPQKLAYNRFNDVHVDFVLNEKPSMNDSVLLCTLSSKHASRFRKDYSNEQLIALSRTLILEDPKTFYLEFLKTPGAYKKKDFWEQQLPKLLTKILCGEKGKIKPTIWRINRR